MIKACPKRKEKQEEKQEEKPVKKKQCYPYK
jgi:hypothetical protein